ncbi:hypothetical protein CFI11_10580 [Thalassococcus sp. S3]|nr:hypothetical protein CFI11_10580 [Thalassococcus sp. S3]
MALQLTRHYARQLWVRVMLMGLLAFLSLGLTQLVEPFVPSELASGVPGSSADRLLNLIASAMLAVTTFSLTVMVSVYQASSSQWTPRVHQLIMQDAVTQNTLAAFTGAFVFSLVAIILRETGIYVDDRALVLFWTTVLVLAYVVFSLIRWVLHLQTLGSLIDTTRQIEEITLRRFEERLQTPCLGACSWTDDIPSEAWSLNSERSGYVQHVFADALQEVAVEHDVRLFLHRAVGSFIFANEPLLWIVGEPDDPEKLEHEIVQLLVLGDVRTHDQDPRFGLLLLSEIGSRALSPGINDPGTAIDVLNRMAKILGRYRDETSTDTAPRNEHLYVRPLDPRDLLMDAFGGIARDGAHLLEVQQRLQKALGSLAHHPDPGLSSVAAEMAREYYDRASEALDWAADRDRLSRHLPQTGSTSE